MDENISEMSAMFTSYILDGECLIQKLKEKYFTQVRGIHKLQKKITMDIIFLKETLQKNNMKKEHLICTNLHFYKALAQETQTQPESEAVLETFCYITSDDCYKRLTVDIVSHGGQQWTKVVARNPVALHQIYKEGDSFGRRSLKDQATSYILAAAQNLHLYCSPQIVFSFVNGVPDEMKDYLEAIGIIVKGTVITLNKDTPSDSVYSDNDDVDFICNIYPHLPPKQKILTRLNLCITSMIAYVSELTNGGCNSKFLEPLLNQQAEWERNSPVKPLLINHFKGKELICCSTAIQDFKTIIDLIGGEKEKCRADNLLTNIRVVPDVSFTGLKSSGKIKKRSLLIFGTGHEHEAITITANKGFIQAAKQKGVRFAVILHESRALTERKQLMDSSQQF